MRRSVYLLLFGCLLMTSCNKESISLLGDIKNGNARSIALKMKSLNGKELCLAEAKSIKDGEFEAYLQNIKPPCKLTLIIDNEKEYDFWIFRYGKYQFEMDCNEPNSVKIYDSFENSEYDRIQANYHNMYLKSIKKKENWVCLNEQEEQLSEEDEFKLFEYRKEIKKAYKLRKKSILSTYRKSPQNPIALALVYDEYERLTSWQKEECLKSVRKSYSDCGINWQLKN